jgi:hypothetical protein
MLTFASTLPGIFNNLVSSVSRISHRQTMRRMYLQKDSHKMHIGRWLDYWGWPAGTGGNGLDTRDVAGPVDLIFSFALVFFARLIGRFFWAQLR